MNHPTMARCLAAAAGVLALAACNDPAGAPSALGAAFSSVTVGSCPTPVKNQVILCKIGSSATFDVTTPGGTSTVSLTDGGSATILTNSGANQTASATEQALSGFQLDSIVVVQGQSPNQADPLTLTSTVFTGTNTASAFAGLESGALITFYNSALPPPPSGEGRMTGGGKQIDLSGISITRGFTIHCDIILSNNLEINWPGNKWHLDKPLTSAQCFDDPAYDETPPVAPFNTFIGEGIGTLNGVDGSLVKFTFIDAGEPGRNDKAGIQIFDAGGALVLDLPLSLLNNGNIQAHFDQPHKQ